MKAQTRIFSVATTIACFALASPGFAQTYIGGSNKPSVQIDLGALDTLPGPAQSAAMPAHHRGKKNNKNVTADAGDYETTIIGGGSDALAPVTILHTGNHLKPTPAKPKQIASADDLNAMQLSPQKNAAANTASQVQASMPPSAMPLDNTPAPTSNPAAPTQPFDKPRVPPGLPEDHAVAALPPARDDYDERRRQYPALPIEPVLPPAGPAPEEANGAQKTTFVLPKLPADTPVTTDALNRAELNQILVQNGQEPLPPLALAPAAAQAKPKPAKEHHAAKAAAPHKRRVNTKTANASALKPKKAPVVAAEPAPASGGAIMPLDQRPAVPAAPVKTKAPVKKSAAVRPAPSMPQPVLTADSLNRQELAKLSSPADQTPSAPPVNAAPPAPVIEETKIAPPPPVILPPAPPPVPIQKTISTPPPPPVAPTSAPLIEQAKIAPPPVVAPVSLPPAPVQRTAPIVPPTPRALPPAPPVQPAPQVVLPQPTKAPASTPEDLIDEGPQPYQPRTRIITDSNAPQTASSPSNFSVGHYDIPSDIQLNGNQQPAPITRAPVAPPIQPAVIAPAPIAPPPPAAPAPVKSFPIAPPAPVVQSPPSTPLDQTPIIATPLPEPAAPPKKAAQIVTPPPAKPSIEAAPQAAPTTEAMPLDQPISLLPAAPAAAPAPKPAATPKEPLPKARDTTQTLNQTELSKSVTAMPLDQPSAVVTAPAPIIKKAAAPPPPPPPPPPETKLAPAPIAPLPVSPSMAKLGSSDDLAVTFTPGSTALSADTTGRLDMLVGHMKQNPDLHVELRSLASADKESTSKARRTSLARALAIKSYLQSQGVAEDHIDVRALGAPPGQPPADRVDFFLMR